MMEIAKSIHFYVTKGTYINPNWKSGCHCDDTAEASFLHSVTQAGNIFPVVDGELCSFGQKPRERQYEMPHFIASMTLLRAHPSLLVIWLWEEAIKGFNSIYFRLLYPERVCKQGRHAFWRALRAAGIVINSSPWRSTLMKWVAVT